MKTYWETWPEKASDVALHRLRAVGDEVDHRVELPGREPLEGRGIGRVAANPLDRRGQAVGLLAAGEDGQGVALGHGFRRAGRREVAGAAQEQDPHPVMLARGGPRCAPRP